ncbi:MAG: hypothetical protein WCG25_05175 [bacterium]
MVHFQSVGFVPSQFSLVSKACFILVCTCDLILAALAQFVSPFKFILNHFAIVVAALATVSHVAVFL